jgi:hypothetical protein
MPSLAEIAANPTYVAVYFAILLVLVILILFTLRNARKERMNNYGVAGGGIQDRVNTSGASQRFAQDFGQPGQGVHATPYNADIMAVAGAIAPQAGPKERLVNQAGYPDFWEITSELGTYRDEEVDAYRGAGGGAAGNSAAQNRAAAAASGVGPERFSNSTAQSALDFALASSNIDPVSARSMLYP